MYVSYDSRNKISAISDHPVKVAGESLVKISGAQRSLYQFDRRKGNGGCFMSLPAKPIPELKIAVICNWNDKCGISTYAKFLVEAMRPKVKEIRIFSETAVEQTSQDDESVVRCWTRGESLRPMCKQVLAWKPDFIIVQHEYGIFPNACHFFQMMQLLDHVPTAVVMHSVYGHLDKAVYASVIRNIIVHNPKATDCLRATGNTSNIYLIHHGCHVFEDNSEVWNIMQNPYTVLQFGFGFRYKGVERALEAISLLKHNVPKFKNIFYCYLLSTNAHNSRVHDEYYQSLMAKVEELCIEDNVAIIRKYNSDQMLNTYLRLFKVAIFPYVIQPDNLVYGATGAARIALSNGIPVIASDSPLFNDLEGIVPRPDSARTLSEEIDKVFSHSDHRQALVDRGRNYVQQNSWSSAADQYLGVYQQIMAAPAHS
jgi:glycosyltransferase involved in cell wall biosynthesis